MYNILWGWSLFAFDVGSDLKFYYKGLEDQDNSSNNTTTTNNTNFDAAKIVTLMHIILPFLLSFIFFTTMLYNKLVTCNPLKIPTPPLAKLYKTIIECKSFYNNRNIGDSNYEKRKTDLIRELEEQKAITTFSMILEASMESSFQFVFQGLFSLPTLVFSVMDIHEGKMKMSDLVNWKIISIILSFLSFAFTSFNIRYLFKFKIIYCIIKFLYF